jgi:hypothetical protein
LKDVAAEIKKNQVVLFVLTKNNYTVALVEILKALENVSKKIAYITFNQPYNSLLSNFASKKIPSSKFFFIDTVTKSVKQAAAAPNCIFVSAPNALTEISVAFSKALNEQKCDSSIFDSLSMLLVYEKAHSIIQFTHNVITKLRMGQSKGIFLALKEDATSELMKDLYMFVDKVVEM